MSDPAPLSPHAAEKAITLALRLAQTEKAIESLTSGQADAMLDLDGNLHLLRPAQEHLRRTESRLRAVIESIADVIVVVNRGGAIISQNRSARRVLGYEQEELEGMRIFDLVHDNDLFEIHSAFFNVIEGLHESATVQFRHLARDGSYRLMEATVGKLRDLASVGVVISLRTVPDFRHSTGPMQDAFASLFANHTAGETKAGRTPSGGKPPST